MTTTSPVNLAEAKAHLRIDHSDEDAHIERLLVAASQWFESETRLDFTLMEPVPQLLKQGILLLPARGTRTGRPSRIAAPMPSRSRSTRSSGNSSVRGV
jgi:hypothetical protein